MTQYVILKLIGLAILAMLIFVSISILEVALYSYVVDPGHELSFYEAHSEVSAPIIHVIFGFIVFFLVARHWKKKEYHNLSKLIILFPFIYVLLDLAVLLLAGMEQWSTFILIFVLANGAKFLGSYLGYKLTE